MKPRGRSVRSWIVGGSVAFHAALFTTVALIPKPERAEAAAIELADIKKRKEPPKPPPLEDDKPGMVQIERPPKMNWPPQLVLLVDALKANAAAEIAGLSGGESLSFTTQKNFDADLQRIANQIHNYYLLSFKPTSAGELKQHTLKVRVPDYPNAVIQTRKSYWSGTLDAR